MSTLPHDRKRGDCLSPTDPALLQDPLDFLHEDHLRERAICAQMDALVGAEAPGAEAAGRVIGFLRDELPLHIEDEERDLFPMLRRRCAPEDDIGRAIARLSQDHRHAEQDTPRVLSVLKALAAGGARPPAEETAALTRYAAQARRHLILENAIILPFARLRLTPDDRAELCARMMRRRGLGQPKGARDAE